LNSRRLDASIDAAREAAELAFAHGTQAREFELMVNYGMKPLDDISALKRVSFVMKGGVVEKSSGAR
jgi:hypothetical protein